MHISSSLSLQFLIPDTTLHDVHSSLRGEILYLSGDSASKQYGVAEIEGGGVGEHT